ncbi:MAG: NAD(P)H-dependent oxidoreductase [Patescibacteria group bacterium]
MKESINITIVLGSAREERISEKVAKFVLEKTSLLDEVTVSLVDVKDFLFGRTIPPWQKDERTDIWKEIALKSDGFIFVVPEYNHGYPGEFKILLDSAHDEYIKKPALLVTVSDGPWGGARMAENLKPILNNFGIISLPSVLHTSFADKKFSDGKNPDDKYQEQLQKSLNQLVEYARSIN